MGIHGLTGFIDNNQHLLNEHELHSCCVVLDGNNFYHFLYYGCHVQCSFGGDYDIYRKKIISTFESFRTCGITPYVVMDGAYTVDGRKLRTSLSRAESRIKLVDTMANNHRGQALPALAYETFMQTLTELGVQHATCQFEADNEIAVLANKLKCPVISNDSDFYIFDLNSGFLPLDYLDFRPLKKLNADGTCSFSFLHCHKYIVDDFINSFEGLNRSVLPVFASMLGNDFIDVSAFSSFYSRVKVPKIVSKKFALPPRLTKVISVLHWLHSQSDSTDFSHIKNELLSFIKPRKKQKVEKLFISSVNGYVDVENFQGFDLFNFFISPLEECAMAASTEFTGYNGSAFPDWFIRSVCKGEMTPSILNCAILHRVIILTQVEDLKLPSSYLCSAKLRQVLYGVLLKGDQPVLEKGSPIKDEDLNRTLHHEPSALLEDSDGGENISDEPENVVTQSCLIKETNLGASDLCYGDTKNEKSVDKKEDDFIMETRMEVNASENLEGGAMCYGGNVNLKLVCIEEYIRFLKNMKKTFVEPVYILGDLSLPDLKMLTSMSCEDRKLILLKAANVDQSFIENFTENLQLFIICIVFWLRHASPKISQLHLDAVIVGVILLKSLTTLSERGRTFEDGSTKGQQSSNLGSQFEDHEQLPGGSQGLLVSASCNDQYNSTVSIDKICHDTSTSDLEILKQNVFKYYKNPPVFNNKNCYEPKITHAFAQLQAVMVDAMNLCKLLRFPFPNCCPAELLNGTFLYNFQTQLFSRPEPLLFLASMLGRGSSLHQIFLKVKTLISEYVGQDCFLLPSELERKRRKKKSKCKVGKETLAESKPEAGEHEELLLEALPGFDIANRFAVLGDNC